MNCSVGSAQGGATSEVPLRNQPTETLQPMHTFESPELLELYQTYTAHPQSVAAHFNAASARATAENPLVVGTGTDIAVFRGGGAAPVVERIRTATGGFKELAAVSHLGPAVAAVMAMKRLDPDGPWRADAERLILRCEDARRANSVELWRDKIAVEAYRGREQMIAQMIDYCCRVTERFLQRSLRDPSYLCVENLQDDYLEGPGENLPVPMNRMMVATFFLTGLDIAYRIIRFFDRLDLEWERTMVMMVGRSGKPTGAVTRESHSVGVIIDIASRGRLAVPNLLIAPHAPVFPPFDGTNLSAIAATERGYREFWSQIVAMADLAAEMFSRYPAFVPRRVTGVLLTEDIQTIDSMPRIEAADDWFALTTRLRMVLEDPQQVLSAAVTDFAARQLVEHNNDPTAVTVPGLDGEPYPKPKEMGDRSKLPV